MQDTAVQWEIPEGLSETGQRAAEIIRDFCAEHNLTDAGQQVFHNPKEWRSSDYGHESELIVLHEGGDHARACSLDYAYEQAVGRATTYDLYEALSRRLSASGIYMEACHKWHSAVYVEKNFNN